MGLYVKSAAQGQHSFCLDGKIVILGIVILLIEDTVPDPKLGIGERSQSNIRVDSFEHHGVFYTHTHKKN